MAYGLMRPPPTLSLRNAPAGEAPNTLGNERPHWPLMLRRKARALISAPAPLRALRARTLEQAWARRAAGEGVSSCPRGSLCCAGLELAQSPNPGCGRCSAAGPHREAEVSLRAIFCRRQSSGAEHSAHREFQPFAFYPPCVGGKCDPMKMGSLKANPCLCFGESQCTVISVSGTSGLENKAGG